MENKETNIDDLFKNGLGDYTELPPPATWDRLEKKLDGIQTKKPGQYYRWLGYFGMVSLLLLLGASVGRNLTGFRSYNANGVATAGQTSKDGKTATTKNINSINIPTNQTATNRNTPDVTEMKNAPGDDYKQISDRNAPAIAGLDKTTQTKNAFPANKKKNTNKYAASHSKKGNRNGKTDNENDDQEENVYNSTASGISSKPALQNSIAKPAEKTKELAAKIPTKATAKLTLNSDDKKAAKQKDNPYFPRFEVGVKAGYETGFDNNAAKKAVVSPYLQYNLTPKWSVMLQPSIKTAFLSSRIIGTPQSYYKVNNDGKVTTQGNPVIDESSLDTVLWIRTYTYSESHDSIVKTSSIGGAYMEYEVPVLLKYNIGKKFSVYGGVNLIYSKLISIAENTSISKPIVKSAPPTQTISEYNQPAPALVIDSSITYSGNPISSYKGPQYPATNSSALRCGYMLGFTYQYEKRWLFDALVQQGFAPANIQGGYNINSALSSAYLRLTIGYKLTK